MGAFMLPILNSSFDIPSEVTMITSPGIPQHWNIVIIGLMIILSLKESLSFTKIWNKDLNSSFNLVILPLVVCFAFIITFKTIEIISANGF